MKLSFSIPSKSSSKQPPPPSSHRPIIGEDEEQEADRSNRKEYVTEFDPSKTLNPNLNSIPKIIPPLQNEYRPLKRMKNLDLPPLNATEADADTDARFEVESLSSAADPHEGKMSYGLNIRQQTENNGNGNGNEAAEEVKPSRTEDVLLEILRYDLKRVPEDTGFDEFKEMPVESFAKALLAGYGWHEGRGVGKNAKEDVKVKEYHKRTDKQGIGYFSQPDTNIHKDKETDRRKEKRDMHREEEKDEKGDGFIVGRDVRVIGGRREDTVGSKGTILERLDLNWVILKLAKTGEKVKVRIVDIARLGSREEEKCLKKLKELKIGKVSNGHQERRNAEPSMKNRERVNRGNGEVKVDLKPRGDRGVQWLWNHIRVRIISKDLKGGRLYLKKGEVVDVVGPYLCDITMDENRELLQHVDQDLLETALPRRGGPVLVLYGKHKGVYGNLVQRDLDREIGVVQESGTHELLNVKLEQLAEYIGDPSYIG